MNDNMSRNAEMNHIPCEFAECNNKLIPLFEYESHIIWHNTQKDAQIAYQQQIQESDRHNSHLQNIKHEETIHRQLGILFCFFFCVFFFVFFVV